MFEALEYYQRLAENFQSRLLTVPGIFVLLLGLCVWLAGLRWRKILGAIAGGGMFAVAAVSIGSIGVPVILAVVFIGVVIGALVEKIMFGIFGTVAIAAIVLFVISENMRKPQTEDVEFYSGNSDRQAHELTADDFISDSSYPMWPQYEDPEVAVTAPQAIEITAGMTSYLIKKAVSNIKASSVFIFFVAAVAAIVAVLIVLIMPRIFIAAVSSSLGTGLIFMGMILLLFYKASKPINHIAERSQFFATVFGAMVIFGTVVQLILSPPAVKQTKINTPDKKNGDKNE